MCCQEITRGYLVRRGVPLQRGLRQAASGTQGLMEAALSALLCAVPSLLSPPLSDHWGGSGRSALPYCAVPYPTAAAMLCAVPSRRAPPWAQLQGLCQVST